MKHLFERLHSPNGQDTSRLHKKASHLSLPTFIDLAASHTRACPFKVFGFEVPDQQSVRTQKQRVVVPSRLAQSREHLRPHAAVAGFVFLQPFRSYLQNEANTFHVVNPRLALARQRPAIRSWHPLAQESLRQPAINGNYMSRRFGARFAGQPDDRAGTVLRENAEPGEGALRVEVGQFRAEFSGRFSF